MIPIETPATAAIKAALQNFLKPVVTHGVNIPTCICRFFKIFASRILSCIKYASNAEIGRRLVRRRTNLRRY